MASPLNPWYFVSHELIAIVEFPHGEEDLIRQGGYASLKLLLSRGSGEFKRGVSPS
jgi:hypothetical protein